ncbi:cupin [Bacillus sp. NEB1478]|uniref:cupin n=1 Tax=Bacillus sp. NEB1478 TaxID=3073816 RepID=UPI002873B723|nr:cupin [Bacillus sp. NEB1478]WNB91097.1 cupin [Bacillus sp. NEB1478]
MQLFHFGKESGTPIDKFDSNFIMSRIVLTKKPAHIGCMHLEKGGIIGYHQAVVPQLLLIVSGEGYVRGESEEFVPLIAGEAVFWIKDEYHETRIDNGLTAIVIESEELTPASFMKEKKIESRGL